MAVHDARCTSCASARSSPRSRIRMGLAVLKLQKTAHEVGPFEGITARQWIRDAMGAQPYEKVWGPLLRGKFGDRADDISMAWLWGKLTMRRKLEGKEARQELLGYPGRSWEPLFHVLQGERIETRGGRVLIDRPAARLGQRADGFEVTAGAPGSFRTGHDPHAYDARRRARALRRGRRDRAQRRLRRAARRRASRPRSATSTWRGSTGIEYHTALCLLLELDRQFSPFYWTNIADPELPFVGLVEHTNFVEPERYDGRRFLYVANYLAPGDELLELDADALIERYTPGLRKVNPGFDRSWIKERWLHREPAAQPIVTVGYRERIPPLQTGVPHLILANTTQIYPEDRGTNYAVRLGGDAAEALLSRRLNNVWSETGS